MDVRMEDLSLFDDEEKELLFDVVKGSSSGTDYKLCLVGRFLTNHNINFNIMQHRMASVWCPGKGINIKDIGSHLFLFQFFHIVDLKRVIEGEVHGLLTTIY